MRVGIATEETWGFLGEVHAEIVAHHQTDLFKRRVFGVPLFNARLNRAVFRRDLAHFLRSHDVVFFEWASELLAAATQLPKTTPIVTRLHRYELYRWADKVNWDAVDTIILVSDAKCREFVRRFPAHAAKAIVIPEAISPERFVPIYRPFRGDIGILCHLRPRKRVYDLIVAFSGLAAERPELHLHVGGGEARGFEEYAVALPALVERLGLQDRVTFYGHVQDPPVWYHGMDVIVSNSYSEGLQVSLLEAMAMRRYCLSHQWDGADELLPPANLFLTEQQLQQRVLDYCDASDDEREALQDRMRAIATERFDVNRTKVQIRRVLESAVAGRRS